MQNDDDFNQFHTQHATDEQTNIKLLPKTTWKSWKWKISPVSKNCNFARKTTTTVNFSNVSNFDGNVNVRPSKNKFK